MKKVLFLIIASFFVLNACEDDLDLTPISDPGSNGFYLTQSDFTQALSGAYAAFGVQNNVDYRVFTS